jgi:histidine triad (HIT) family protein
MNCKECELIKTRKHIVYEDELASAFLTENPAVPGHILVLPKEHFLIVEQVPDKIIEHLFFIANKISTICFEIFNAQGTNILINNGLAAGQKRTHATVHVLPRFENDGLNFQWNTIKPTEDEMSTAELTLKAEIEKEEAEKYSKKEEIKEEKLQPKEEIPEEENYMLRQLDRIP